MRQTNGGEVRELKIGQSFFFKSGSGGGGNPRNRRQPTFHTIKYDFKPESTKTSSAGSMDVDSDNRVNVQIPHDGGGQTNFRLLLLFILTTLVQEIVFGALIFVRNFPTSRSSCPESSSLINHV